MGHNLSFTYMFTWSMTNLYQINKSCSTWVHYILTSHSWIVFKQRANMSIINTNGHASNRGPPCYLFPEAFQGCVILFPPQCQCWWIVSPSIATIATITQISNIVPKTEIKAVSLSPVTLISFAPLYHCITLMHIHKFGWNLKSSANSNLQKLSNVANQSSNMKIWKYTLSSKGRAIC